MDTGWEATVACFLSIQRSPKDSSNFDDDFTFQPAQLTPTDPQLVLSIDQNNFAGFSFTSDHAMWTMFLFWSYRSFSKNYTNIIVTFYL